MRDRSGWHVYWIRIYFALIWAVFLVIGLTYFSDGSVFATILGALMTALSGAGLFRAMRAGVCADARHLLIRKFFWTRKIRWSDVVDVRVVRSNHLIPWRLLAIQTKTELIKVPEIASLSIGRTSTKVDQVADNINEFWNCVPPNDRGTIGS